MAGCSEGNESATMKPRQPVDFPGFECCVSRNSVLAFRSGLTRNLGSEAYNQLKQPSKLKTMLTYDCWCAVTVWVPQSWSDESCHLNRFELSVLKEMANESTTSGFRRCVRLSVQRAWIFLLSQFLHTLWQCIMKEWHWISIATTSGKRKSLDFRPPPEIGRAHVWTPVTL